jgi:hypothetical protein
VAILAVTLKVSVWIAIPAAVALSGLVGALLALPALRVKGPTSRWCPLPSAGRERRLGMENRDRRAERHHGRADDRGSA